MRKFGRNVLQDREKLTSWVGTAWMLYVAQQPDFEAIRNGVTYLFECSDYDWKDKDMFNISCTKMITELESIYPVHVQSMRFYNAGMFLNLLLSMSRRMLPPQISRKFHVKGYDPQRGYLDQLFVAPNLESANQRNLARVRNALQIRFDNEASFSLD
ncbi:expressed unknown protein [Seminavis robusta]|uniref:CRAL-TRIO domain-containing protein n=1 Tax=Seminavis robusta TaxID=568900 RepID=A0A9N8EVQ0_9STRA|nr:expressed unknown protein [Seminavis robusta]|eukprot:Sro1700_g292080.1 n/a (157) ;mRNA; r:654-1124